MAYRNAPAQDACLDVYKDSDKMYACSAEPADYAEAVSLALADMGTPVFGTNEDYATGRQSVVAAIENGIGIATGTATHYALVTVGTTTLQARKTLGASYPVVDTEVVKSTAYNVQVPDQD